MPFATSGDGCRISTTLSAARRPAQIKSLGLLSTPFDGSRIGAVIDTWRSIIEREGMAGWSEALMPMRFAPGSIDKNARHYAARVGSGHPRIAGAGSLPITLPVWVG